MSGPTVFDHTGDTLQLELGTSPNMVPAQSPMSHWRNLHVLFGGGEVAGTNKHVPHRVGDIATPRRNTTSTKVLEGLISGAADVHGAPYANAVAGLESNIRYIRYYAETANLNTTTGTHTARFVTSVGTTYGPVHTRLTVGDIVGPGLVLATLELELPDGDLLD